MKIPRCVVTGASSGIGRQIARLFAMRGFHVIACGRSQQGLEQTAANLKSDFVLETRVFDVRDRQAQHEVLTSLGEVDVFVPAAGVCKQARIDEDHADEVWEEVMDVNVNAVWNGLRSIVPHLSQPSSVVLVSSGLGKNGRPGYEAYAASKHAILGLTKCLALELAPRAIRVNAVCPGWVDTPMARADIDYSAGQANVAADQWVESGLANIAMGRMVRPDEVAELVYWLSSEGASAITGQQINISCGEFFH